MSNFLNTVDSIGDEALANSIIDRSITEIRDNYVKSIGSYAFCKCSALTTADFPAVTSIDEYAFSYCSQLTTVDFPAVTYMKSSSFMDCSALTTADFPAVRDIGEYALSNCSQLTSVALKGGSTINNNAFQGCSNLKAVIIRSNTITKLSSSDKYLSPFRNTPIASGKGYIYVPAALVDSYKAASNWSTYANQIRAIEDYTVDGTTTGALDESKI